MPKITIRNMDDVPSPNHATKAVREAQMEYEGFLQAINSDVGELELSPAEQVRGVKVRLRRAATRLGKDIDIWDVDGRVYFQHVTKRGRPKKTDE